MILKKIILATLLAVLTTTVTYAQKPDWSVNSADYNYSMSHIGVVYINGVLQADEHALIAAFKGEEIRGIASPVYDDQTQKHIFYLLTYSNIDLETLTFKYYNSVTDALTTFDMTDTFRADGISGAPFKPFVWSDPVMNESKLLSFAVEGLVTSKIVDNKVTIVASDKLDIENAIADFEVSTGAKVSVNGTIQVSGLTVNNYSEELVFKVSSADESTETDYSLNILLINVSSAELSSFTIDEQLNSSISENQVKILMPEGYDLTELKPTFELSPNASVTVAGAVQLAGQTAQDFTNELVYKVISFDGSTETLYTVRVETLKYSSSELLSFFIEGQLSADILGKQVKVVLPAGSDVSNIKPVFETSPQVSVLANKALQVSGETANDFSDELVYILTSEDGSSESLYTINVEVLAYTGAELLSFSLAGQTNAEIMDGEIHVVMPTGVDKTELIAEFEVSDGAQLSVNSKTQLSGETINDFSEQLSYTVNSQDGNSSYEFQVYVLVNDLSVVKASAVVTPNGDGINDQWKVADVKKFNEATFYILDGSGHELHKSTGYDNSWNGTYNGQLLPIGTYYYLIDVPGGKMLSGTISVIH